MEAGPRSAGDQVKAEQELNALGYSQELLRVSLILIVVTAVS